MVYVLRCLGSIIYGLFAGGAVDALFPPPYVPGLSEGRGLDLRGMALVLGSWIGGILGSVAVMATFLVSTTVHRRRNRIPAMGQQLPTE